MSEQIASRLKTMLQEPITMPRWQYWLMLLLEVVPNLTHSVRLLRPGELPAIFVLAVVILYQGRRYHSKNGDNHSADAILPKL